nr:uncharacterized protein LOC123753213 [Procambarus clarkii]
MSVGGSSCSRLVVMVVLTVALLVGVALSAPPSPTASKRSAEDIQFGNQQNPPVSLLDDNALPGAFPSSENSDENTIGKGGGGREQVHQQQQEQQLQSEDDDPRQQEDSQEDVDEDEEGSLVAPVAEPNTWHVPAPHSLHLYQLGWRTPVVYGAAAYPGRRRRRRRSVYAAAAATHPDPRKVPQVPLKVLRAGQRHKRDLRRYRRDLATGADMEKLLEDVDVVELLAMLAGAPHRRPGGYGTVSYAPAPPRYAPQPKLFPDYEVAEEEEGGEDRGVGSVQQDVRAARLPEAVMVPAGGRVWRRSGGYGLSSMPGFKRSASAFRANRPHLPSPAQGFSQADLHSLAVMLGAELDPVTHRLRRTAM